MSRLADTTRMLDTLCPMHLVVAETGCVMHVGPTLQKLRPDASFMGRMFFDIFDLKRPRSVKTMQQLCAVGRAKLHLQLRDGPKTEIKGVRVAGPDPGLSIINLSFGISIVDAVRDYALSGADFAATDLAIEMLYLVEAKSAAMDASRNLNLRLQDARIIAEEQAYTDSLTGLKNRRAVNHILTRNIESGMRFGVMQLDLDWFKAVNDTLGHAAGDHVLQTVSRYLMEETRDSDTVARIGGDEFVVILSAPKDCHAIERIGQRIIRRLSRPILFRGDTCHVSVSIGTAFYEPESGKAMADILDDADVALYASKQLGRGIQTVYDPRLRQSDKTEGGAAPRRRA